MNVGRKVGGYEKENKTSTKANLLPLLFDSSHSCIFALKHRISLSWLQIHVPIVFTPLVTPTSSRKLQISNSLRSCNILKAHPTNHTVAMTFPPNTSHSQLWKPLELQVISKADKWQSPQAHNRKTHALLTQARPTKIETNFIMAAPSQHSSPDKITP
jgi:hypothetical protein